MQDPLPYLDTPMDVNPVNTRQLSYPKIIDFLCDDVKKKKKSSLNCSDSWAADFTSISQHLQATIGTMFRSSPHLH